MGGLFPSRGHRMDLTTLRHGILWSNDNMLPCNLPWGLTFTDMQRYCLTKVGGHF
jgi:hypothetical protein